MEHPAKRSKTMGKRGSGGGEGMEAMTNGLYGNTGLKASVKARRGGERPSSYHAERAVLATGSGYLYGALGRRWKSRRVSRRERVLTMDEVTSRGALREAKSWAKGSEQKGFLRRARRCRVATVVSPATETKTGTEDVFVEAQSRSCSGASRALSVLSKTIAGKIVADGHPVRA